MSQTENIYLCTHNTPPTYISRKELKSVIQNRSQIQLHLRFQIAFFNKKNSQSQWIDDGEGIEEKGGKKTGNEKEFVMNWCNEAKLRK